MSKGDENKKNERITLTSPLYLHPSDGPSLLLTQTVFTGENYDLWVDPIRNGLDAKNKLAFVEGHVKQPTLTEGEQEIVNFIAWRQCNAMLKSWLQNVIDPKLHSSITFYGPVSAVWIELKEHFSQGNAPRVHQLKQELTDCKQGKNQSVVDYYTRLKTIWDELSNYSRVLKCTCGVGASLLKEREEEKVHQFLMGLDSLLYGHIWSNLLMEDEITILSRAYALVLREERHRVITQPKDDILDAAMTVKNKGISGPPTNMKSDNSDAIICTYCDKYGHT